MSDKNKSDLSLGEAAGLFLSRETGDKESNHQEISRFVRWYGSERSLVSLTAPEVANYAERLATSDPDYARKLELVRAFLVHASKEKWTSSNLAVHLKARKSKSTPVSSRCASPETVPMTRDGYARLGAELETLKSKRHHLIDEMRRAAADKDFRENAPLAAAREQRGLVEGRIKELEAMVKVATIIDEERKPAHKATTGDSVVLCDLASGEELRYTIVSPREVDVTKCRISNASPIGKALVGRSAGDIVEVTAPRAKLRYRIERVER